MKAVLAALALLAVTVAPLPAPAQSAGQTAQQHRMMECNAAAGTRGVSGDARRQFMSDCLAGRVPATATPQGGASQAQAAQRQRMTSCNATAAQRKLSGTARQDFMKSCLSGG